jgi:hypothetical protein
MQSGLCVHSKLTKLVTSNRMCVKADVGDIKGQCLIRNGQLQMVINIKG